MTATRVRCGGCSLLLDDRPDADPVNRLPCPACGSRSRAVEVFTEDHAEVHERVGLKARKPGVRRPVLESVSGDDLTVATGTWVRLERTIDRAGGRYRERIVDPTTGQVIRDVDEPLSEHQDHGSAKFGAPREDRG